VRSLIAYVRVARASPLGGNKLPVQVVGDVPKTPIVERNRAWIRIDNTHIAIEPATCSLPMSKE